MTNALLGIFNLGGGEILLILALLSVLGLVAVATLVLMSIIIQAIGGNRPAQRPAAPSSISADKP